MRVLYAPAAQDTERIGRHLGEVLFPGAFVAVGGGRGAGQTSLSKAIGRGLGVRSRVASPTFAIVMVHEGGRLPLVHADLYRLGSADELEHTGFDELVDGAAVVLVERADRFEDALPADRLVIELADDPRGGRRIALRATGPRHQALLDVIDG